MKQFFSSLSDVDWTSWLGREPWSILFAGFGGALLASLLTFLLAVWVLRRTLSGDRAAANRRNAEALLAVDRQVAALAEAHRRERTIAAAAQLTSGWVTPGWEWVALGPNLIRGLPERRRWELVRRWLSDTAKLYMNLTDDEQGLHDALTRTTSVLHGLLDPDGAGPEAYLSTARSLSQTVNDWVRGDLSADEATAAIEAEVDRVEAAAQVA